MSNVISFNSHAKLGSVIGEASISEPNIFRYRELVFDVAIFVLSLSLSLPPFFYPTSFFCSSLFSFVTVSVANKPHGLCIQILYFYYCIRIENEKEKRARRCHKDNELARQQKNPCQQVARNCSSNIKTMDTSQSERLKMIYAHKEE